MHVDQVEESFELLMGIKVSTYKVEDLTTPRNKHNRKKMGLTVC